MRESWPIVDAARHTIADLSTMVSPTAVLDMASRLGRMRHRVRQGSPASGDLAELFEGRPVASRDYTSMARTIAGHEARKVALRALVHRRGNHIASALLDDEGLDALEPLRHPTHPLIAMTCHFGAPLALAAAFGRLGISAFAIRHSDARSVGEGSALAATMGDERQQAAALWRAVHWLRDTGVVAVAADGGDGHRTAPVLCLGRAVAFGRGAFAMARLSGAAVLPLVGLWTPTGRIRMHAGEAMTFPGGLPIEAFENASTRAFAAWYERLILSNPTQLRVGVLRRFLAAPRVAPDLASDRRVARQQPS